MMPLHALLRFLFRLRKKRHDTSQQRYYICANRHIFTCLKGMEGDLERILYDENTEYKDFDAVQEVCIGKFVHTQHGRVYIEFVSNRAFFAEVLERFTIDEGRYDYDNNGRIRVYREINFKKGMNFDYAE